MSVASTMPPISFASLVDLLRERATKTPSKVACTYLDDGAFTGVEITYEELDARARTIATNLQTTGHMQDRCILVYPPGLDFICAFFGCLYAGRIAVPLAYPASPSRLELQMQTMRAIVDNAGARTLLTTAPFVSMLESVMRLAPETASLEILCSDQMAEVESHAWIDPAANSSTIAFLQYTSGSTGSPKGVIVRHGNLLHNLACVAEKAAMVADDRVVSWLPHYHDMGLIGGILQPLFAGATGIFFSPYDFLKHPLRWLEIMSHHRATVTCAPTFAYASCVRRMRAGHEVPQDLRLHDWHVAVIGAEPIAASILDDFTAFFAPYGFHAETFLPCYGLAESTLMASGIHRRNKPTQRFVDASALRQGEAIFRDTLGDRISIAVGCGVAIDGQEIQIVDPSTRRRLPALQIGELWLRGPSVGGGYWNNEAATAETFRGFLADSGEGPFLRTGDLGFLDERGEVFITGRSKDLIIIRGHNHYPHDIERTASGSHAAIREGGVAAFAIDVSGEERVVILAEIARSAPSKTILSAIKTAVTTVHQVQVHDVVLLPPKRLSKTSSGKLRRSLYRDEYLGGLLSPWVDEVTSP